MSKQRIVFLIGKAWEKWDERSIDTGIGGSETAAVLLGRALSRLGYEVKIFADPAARRMDGTGADVEYISWREWERDPESYAADFLVCSRTAEPLYGPTVAGKKFVWIHDIFLHPSPEYNCCIEQVDYYFCLSEWHREFVHRHHNIPLDKILITTNGIDQRRYDAEVERNPHQLIYSSSPDRGLDTLLHCSRFIRRYVPDLTIKVAYGFETLEKMAAERNIPEEVSHMKELKSALRDPGVEYLGRIGQADLARHQKQSSGWFYPTRYVETNCITAIESGFAGNPILSSRLGGLKSTIRDGGILLEGDAYSKDYRERFVEEAIRLLTQREYWNEWSLKARQRMERFSWDRVAAQWHTLFKTGGFEMIQ